MPRRYTSQEDALIKAASFDELTALAKRLGRQRYNIVNRRARLRRGDEPSLHRKPEPESPPPKPQPVDVLSGRPEWFDDVSLLHNRLRAGR